MTQEDLMAAIDYNKLLSFCRTLTSNGSNVMAPEDLAQDTIMTCLTNLAQYSEKGKFGGWVATICYNIFNGTARRESRYVHVECTVEPELDTAVIEFDVKSFLDTLDPIYREVLELSMAGWKYREIAKILNVPIGTICSRVNSIKNNYRVVQELRR